MSRFMMYRGRFRNNRIFRWLTEELAALIPNFDPYGEDGYLIDFAYKDLKATLKASRKIEHIHLLGAGRRIESLIESNPDEFRSFLKVWVSKWLEKWRERVVPFDMKNKKPEDGEEGFYDAKRVYRTMKGRKELLDLVQQTLIEHGEVCMVKLIAENLILGELSKYLSERKRKNLPIFEPNPVKIYQRILEQIKRITKRKEPLVYLRLRPFNPYYF